MIGQTISHYKILEKLGEGGMGVVYKAHDTKLNRFVALKFLPPRLTASEKDRKRFIQEAKAAATLNHPNIAVIYEIGDANGETFIVMEYIEGESLKARIQEGLLPIEKIIDIGLQIAEGLKVAHEKGIIHRDVKSENVMVAKDGRVRIMDFGLAKLKGGVSLTKTGSTVGTLAYMSPEQIQGLEVDQRTDLWAFGVVLYEMLTGELPFQGEHEAAVMYEILNLDPKAIQTLQSDVPEHLQVLVSRLLQKDPTKRSSSAAEIVEQLKKPPTITPSATGMKSIAVLYFENMSAEKESDYFCAGITEDIITDLSKIKELKVVSRTDVLPFRRKEINTRQVGEVLRVNYILEGSVRKAGTKIRITAQLIDVGTGFHLWAERFDRLVEDIFEVQTEVSQKIAEALKISLTESEKQSIARKPTDDVRAYDFYMRGRELLYRRGKKNNELAIQMFENAIAIDPDFASAYAALVEAYSYMYSWYDGDAKWLGKIIEMSQKALSLDPEAVEAQFGIGMVYFHQRRYAEAKKTFEKVTQQQPDYYDAYRWLGIISDIYQDYDAAIRYYQSAASIKPYSEEPWLHLEREWRRKNDLQSSDETLRKIIEAASAKLEMTPDDIVTMSGLAIAYARFGAKEEAYRTLRGVIEIDPTDGLALYNCACAYATLGEKQEALACLRIAIESGWKGIPGWVKGDPGFDSLREAPEFRALVTQFS